MKKESLEPKIDPKALFLGPYSENGREFRELLETVITDIMQWRRNYHPQKKRIIQPNDKTLASWVDTNNNIQRELDKLLGDLKESIPFHNPHFLGHMHSDLAMPALLGYAAGQLYNQNNVVGESSPVTTAKELDFARYLCEMVRYPKFEYPHDGQAGIRSTGHLSSGGTTANIEALWTARNLKYFPLSLYIIVNSDEIKKMPEWPKVLEAIRNQIHLQKGSRAIEFGKIDVRDLFNLSPASTLKLMDDLRDVIQNFVADETEEGRTEVEGKLSRTAYNNVLKKYTVRSLGVWKIHDLVQKLSGVELCLPVLLLPQSRHYSWEKAMDILGMGTDQIRYVKVNEHFKIDERAFEQAVNANAHILMAVGVVGTTEEGTVDPIAKMLEYKSASQSKGKSFFFHIDAAYGGYYASIFNPSATWPPAHEESIQYPFMDREEQQQRYSGPHVITDWLDEIGPNIEAMHEADSITIDPHKLGYIPYSCGAILYKDHRTKAFIEKKAPYLATDSNEDQDYAGNIYLGGSILEGSRSGAAALACYLTSRIIPNNGDGYGLMMSETFRNAKAFLAAMKSPQINRNSSQSIEIVIKPLYEAATNIVCYAVGVRGFRLSPKTFKALNERLFVKMSAGKNKSVQDYKFIISKTSLSYVSQGGEIGYEEHIERFLRELNVDFVPHELKNEEYELVLLRSVLMNPLLGDQREEIFAAYFGYVSECVMEILPELLLMELKEERNKNRLKVLWVENKKRLGELETSILHGDRRGLDLSRYLEIDFLESCPESLKDYDLYIVDLNLTDTKHKEWVSGLKVISDIKMVNKNAPVIVYSQFLNPDFKLEANPDYNPTAISEYLKHYAEIDPNALLPKNLGVDGKEPIEVKDLALLTIRLAQLSLEPYHEKA